MHNNAEYILPIEIILVLIKHILELCGWFRMARISDKYMTTLAITMGHDGFVEEIRITFKSIDNRIACVY